MNDRYSVILRPAAQRDLDRLPSSVAQRVLKALHKLERNARPRGCKKLAGRKNEWSLRVGAYRVLYEVHDKEKMVRVFRVLPRREAYR